MHKINSAYGRYYNRKYERTGHVFEGRYKSILITDEKYLLSVIRYIHQNPVRAKIAKKPQDYNWSSDGFYRNNKQGFVDIDFILDIISSNRRTAITEYMKFMDLEETGDYENVDIIGKDVEVKGDEFDLLDESLEPLDKLLEETGANSYAIDLIKSGSRKRSLTKYKIEFIKRALRIGYSPRQISEHINTTAQAIINLKERYNL